MDVIALGHSLADGIHAKSRLINRIKDQLFPSYDAIDSMGQFGRCFALNPHSALAICMDQITIAYLHPEDIDVATNALNAHESVAGRDAAGNNREIGRQNVKIANHAVSHYPGAAKLAVYLGIYFATERAKANVMVDVLDNYHRRAIGGRNIVLIGDPECAQICSIAP